MDSDPHTASIDVRGIFEILGLGLLVLMIVIFGLWWLISTP